MEMLVALTPEQLVRAERYLLNPPSGGQIEAAEKYGTDLTLLLDQLRLTPDQLRLTPDQRGKRLEQASTELEKVRGVARRRASCS